LAVRWKEASLGDATLAAVQKASESRQSAAREILKSGSDSDGMVAAFKAMYS
jgi:hypothetical protein